MSRSIFRHPWHIFLCVEKFGLNFIATVRLRDDPNDDSVYAISQVFRSSIDAGYWCEAQTLRILT